MRLPALANSPDRPLQSGVLWLFRLQDRTMGSIGKGSASDRSIRQSGARSEDLVRTEIRGPWYSCRPFRAPGRRGNCMDRSHWQDSSAVSDRISGRIAVSYHELDTVVLNRDLPEQGLRRGDLGAVVQVYGSERLEVEFVTAAGRTQALVTLDVSDVRTVNDQDLLSVRTLVRGAA
jgi:hypothetical protein